MAIIAIAYLTSGLLGLSLGSINNAQISYLWPPSGIAIGCLLLGGRHLWPGVLLGSLAINLWISGNLFASLMVACGATLEAWLPALWLERMGPRFDPGLGSPASVVRFAVAAGIGCFIGTSIAIATLLLWGLLPSAGMANGWTTWFLGDFTGMLVIAPLLLSYGRVPLRQWRPAYWADFVASQLAVVALSYVITFGPVRSYFDVPMFFTLFPVLIWTGLRLGLRESVLAVLVMATSICVAMAYGYQASIDAESSLRFFEVLLLFTSMSALLLGASLSERSRLTARLAASEHRYRELSELSRDMISRHDANGTFLFVSPACELLLGYTQGQMLNHTLTELCHADDVSSLTRALQHLRSGDLGGDIVFRMRHRKGHPVWLEASASRRLAGSGGELVLVSRDITQRKQAELDLQLSEERSRRLIELMPEAVFLHKEQVFQSANWRAAELLEVLSPAVVIGHNCMEFIHADYLPVTAQRLAELNESDQTVAWAELMLHLPNGKDKLVEISTSSFCVGAERLMVSLARDISERKAAEAQLREAAKIYEVALEGIVILEVDGTIRSVNPAFLQLCGYPVRELVGRSIRSLCEGLHDDVFFTAQTSSLADTGRWQGEMSLRRANGSILNELVSLSVLPGNDSVSASYVAVLADITQLKEAEAEYRAKANYDPLTKLPNRNLFQDRLNHLFLQSERSGRHFAILFIDLDGFKPVNDQFGHEAGDLLLKVVAGRLRDCVRKNDTVCRLGGDEFLMLLEDIVEPDMVKHTAARAVDELRLPITVGGRQVNVSASVGIAIYPEDGDNPATLLANADAAMYLAKRGGKNRYAFFSTHL